MLNRLLLLKKSCASLFVALL